MKKKNFRRILLLISAIICFSLVGTPKAAYATNANDRESSFSLTRDEQQYVKNNPVIHVTYLDGSAPIAYTEDGKMKGIMRGVLDEIAEISGFIFVYDEVGSQSELIEAVRAKRVDVIGATQTQFTEELKKYPHSVSFLRAETVLFTRTGMDTLNLSDCAFGAIEGSELPEGIKESNVRFYKNREDTLNAVEQGEVDYCYSNIFSIAYYTAKYGYNNVISIPGAMEAREYSFIYINSDERFVSIMNKAMAAVPGEALSNIIFQSTSNVEQQLSAKAFVQKHIEEVVLAVFMIVTVLAFILFMFYRKSARYKRQNAQYLLLAGISDEYMYEYDFKRDCLKLSKDVGGLLGLPRRIDAFTKSDFFQEHLELKEIISTKESGMEVNLQTNTGEIGIFRIVKSITYNNNKPRRITGKLVDIREEKQKFHELNKEAQQDSFTGLYNSRAIRKLVEKTRSANPNMANAMFIVDIDRFKEVNDTYGHPVGDAILSHIADDLRRVFQKGDIIGRMGGDEFCVFLSGDITEKLLTDKCKQLLHVNATKTFEDYNFPTLSIGVVLNKDNRADFNELYQAADVALYKAKRNGRNGYVLDIIK